MTQRMSSFKALIYLDVFPSQIHKVRLPTTELSALWMEGFEMKDLLQRCHVSYAEWTSVHVAQLTVDVLQDL